MQKKKIVKSLETYEENKVSPYLYFSFFYGYQCTIWADTGTLYLSILWQTIQVKI